MNKNHFSSVLLAALSSVIVLSTCWEFWLEDVFASVVMNEHEPESFGKRVEYVISITVFVAISLIFPAMVGFRLIDNHNRLIDEIKRLSEQDYLTGLDNRRKIHEIIEHEILRSKRYDSVFTVILIDIDDFKATNDTFGHNAGDQLLIDISDVIRRTIRESDNVGRWGGEEFLVFCPETGLDGAISIAEKLRSNIEATMFALAGYKTASLGVARVNPGDTVKSLISRADNALYAAKTSGKNKVISECAS
jgi:diguanylate cyclase (GGDEF)-like protein